MKKKVGEHKKFSDYLLAILLFAPYFMPADYLLPNFANKLILGLKLVLAIIAIVVYYKKNKLDLILVLFALFLISPIISVLTNGEQLVGLFGRIVLLNIYIIIATRILCRKKALSCLKVIMVPYCIGQCVSMFLYYPHGMYTDALRDHNYYLFAHDNISLFSILPSLAIMAIADIAERKKIKINTFCVTILCLSAYIYTVSATAMIMVALILLGFVLRNNKIVKRVIYSVAPEYIFLVVLFAVLAIERIPELSNFFEQTFNKSATISGRTVLWDIAIERIMKRPLIGYGFETSELRMKVFGISHIHNILLQILYNGGFLMLAALIIFYRKLMRFQKTEVVTVIRIYLMLYAIAAIFDFYLDQFISIMPIAILMNNTLDNKILERNKNEK